MPRLLDLFCGVGGASVGYHRAGFDVVGVDVVYQPRYPYEFHHGDALSFPLDGFDVVAASPPCKLHTVARRVTQAHSLTLFDPHPDLLTPTREHLAASGLPYIIENVPLAPLCAPVTVCGSAFPISTRYEIRRHRLFESNVELCGTPCRHGSSGLPIVGVYGDGGAWTRTAPGGGGVKVAGLDAADALGIDWTEWQHELAQAIPPAYTEYLGRQLIAALA